MEPFCVNHLLRATDSVTKLVHVPPMGPREYDVTQFIAKYSNWEMIPRKTRFEAVFDR